MEKVKYTGQYKDNSFDIWTWEGTPLSVIWNQQKQMYSPGDMVIIEDNHGHSMKFVKGMT